MQTCPDHSRQIQTSSDKSIHVQTCLVRHGLKYELYITWRDGQRDSAERAGRLETGSATRNWYFRPIFHRFGRSHVTTGDKAISRSITVYIKSWKKRRKLWLKNFIRILNVHFFVPCGLMALPKAVKYWPEVPIPCSTSGVSRLKTGRATRNWYFHPIFHRFGLSHVTTTDKRTDHTALFLQIRFMGK